VLVHVRLNLPHDLTPKVRDLLLGHECTTNVTLVEGASLEPPGDVIEADLARELTSSVLEDLIDLGVGKRGGIILSQPSGTPFDAAQRLEASAPGHPDDAVIWKSVEGTARAGSVPTVSFHVFLVLAVALAAIAVITDSSVLVVGAMVVGPEFSAVAAVSAGLVLRHRTLVLHSLRLLLMSFAFAIGVVTVLALVARAAGLVVAADVTRARPNTGFIWHPDVWSFIVALLAGAAGALALAIEKTSTMVGVFISVTTVPAAGNLALGLALWQTGEILGSLEQLGANIGGMVVSGTVVLALMRWCWPQVTAYSERIFASRSEPV
jgi:uncharacterized hydrophobic protein (TIGR00271 family)